MAGFTRDEEPAMHPILPLAHLKDLPRTARFRDFFTHGILIDQ